MSAPHAPTPEYLETQRQAALTALAAAQQALRNGQMATAATKLLWVEAHLNMMTPAPELYELLTELFPYAKDAPPELLKRATAVLAAIEGSGK